MTITSLRQAVTVPRLAGVIGSLVILLSCYHNSALLHRVDRIAADHAGAAANGRTTAAAAIADIRSAHWFGAEPAPSAASITYDLKGISIDTAGHAGYALISENGQPEKSYRLHDRLSSGAEIVAIEPGHVVIQTTSGQQRLSLHPAR